MTSFEIYSLVVSLVVIIGLAVFFSFLIGYIYVLTTRLIAIGYWDHELVHDQPFRRRFVLFGTVGKIISTVVCIVLAIMVAFSVAMGVTENDLTKNLASLKVVKSESMSKAHKNNDYIEENNLNDQFQMFDLIVTHPLPAEEDIELYDVIVYERDGNLIIHRVVYIAEPNENVPEYRFYFRGDANKENDDEWVSYDQMRGIYRGKRIPFVGSFILFMQSPAGIICLILAIVGMFIMPIIDQRIEDVRDHRYRLLATGLASPKRYMQGTQKFNKRYYRDKF